MAMRAPFADSAVSAGLVHPAVPCPRKLRAAPSPAFRGAMPYRQCVLTLRRNAAAHAQPSGVREMAIAGRLPCVAPTRGDLPMLKRVAVIGVLFGAFFLAACGSTTPQPNPTPTITGTPIDPSVSGPLGANLAAQVPSLSGSAALSAQAAAVALQAGVQADDVTLTASLLALPPVSGSWAQSRSSSTVTSGAARAFAFQLTILNAPQGPGTQVFSGVVLFQGSTGAAVATGPSPQSSIPPGVGLILSGGMLWEATSGQESAQLSAQGGICPNAPPAFITACNLATFTNAGLAITASTPVAGGATGSQPLSISTGNLVGAALTLDCSKTSLCAAATSVQVSVAPSTATVQPSGTQQFAATVTGASNTAVNWTVQETGGGSISSAGLYTAPSTPGTFHVVATSVADPLESGTATVTVSSTPVVAVSVSPFTATVALSGTQQFTATVTGTANTAVTWSVEEAGGGSVSSTGLYTAPSSTPGTFHVVATSVADNAKSGTATVTVSSASVVAVSVSPSTATVALSGTQQFLATVTGASNTEVTWSVEEAGGGSVSSTGFYTAPPSQPGTFHVVATSVADTTKSGTATVTVPSSAFIGMWYGPYTIVLGAQYLSGNVTVPITPGSVGANNLLSINFLCVAPNFVQATITSSTSFSINPITCPLESNTCATATLTFTGGAGTLTDGELSMSFQGSENVCGTVTDFTGTFGPGMYQGI